MVRTRSFGFHTLSRYKSSFLKGMASVFDISGEGQNIIFLYRHVPVQADIDAIKSDWEAIGLDIKNVIEKAKQEVELKQLSVNE